MKRGCIVFLAAIVVIVLSIAGCRLYLTAQTSPAAIDATRELFELCKAGNYDAAVKQGLIQTWDVPALKASDITYGRVVRYEVAESHPGLLVIPLLIYVNVEREKRTRREVVIQHAYRSRSLQYEALAFKRDKQWSEAFNKLRDGEQP